VKEHQHAYFYLSEDGEEWIVEPSNHAHANGNDVHRHDGVHGYKHKLAMRRRISATHKNTETKTH
jgi:hypothetical protein